MPGIHVMPPPCSEAASSGQVLSAGSPFRGVDHHVHCKSPVTGSNESRKPGMSIASPPTPTITWFFTISGAEVEKYCLRASAKFFRHSSLPVVALRAISQLSGVTK